MDSSCVAGVTQLEEGAVTLGMVAKIDPQRGLLVQLPFGGVGAVAVTDLADAYRPNPLEGYKQNQIIRSVTQSVITHLHHLHFSSYRCIFQKSLLCLRCFLLRNNNGKWQLSLRPSRFGTVSLHVASCVMTSNIRQTPLSGFDVALSG